VSRGGKTSGSRASSARGTASLLDEDEMAETGGVVQRGAHERDVGLASLERGDVLRGRAATDVDLRRGVLLAEGAQDERGDVEVARDAERDPEPAGDALRGVARGGEALGGAGHGAAGGLPQREAGRRERDAARRALEERGAGDLLELVDLPGQRGLGDVQALGGPGEVELLGDGEEAGQQSEVEIHARQA
jgi:hypothetical protein